MTPEMKPNEFIGRDQRRVVNLLAVGIDDRVFDEGPLRDKAVWYSKDFAVSYIVCRTHRKGLGVERIGSTIYFPIYARFSFLFPWLLYWQGRRILNMYKGGWLVSSDSPFEIGLACWILARSVGGIFHLHIHTDFLSPYFRHSSPKDYIRFFIASYVVRQADCIRVVSERVKNSLARLPGLRAIDIVVLPVYTEVSDFMAVEADSVLVRRFESFDFKMLAVGRFVDKEKNFSMLLAVVRDLVNLRPGVLLFLAGFGPDEKKYRALVREYGIEKNVIIEKWDKSMSSLYKAFDIFLLSSNYEGWGRVVIEAMASGLPVVMTDVGLAGEVIHDGVNGAVVPVGDKTRMRDAILILMQNHATSKRMANEARATAGGMGSGIQSDYIRMYRRSLTRCLDGF